VSATASDDRSDHLNGTVRFTAGSITDDAGQPVSSASVLVTTTLPTDPGYLDSFPGPFLGVPTGQSSLVPLDTYSAVNVTLQGQSGGALHLGAGKTADLALPVSAGSDPGTPTVPLWTLDPATAKWRQEGSQRATHRRAPLFTGQPWPHFSWWGDQYLSVHKRDTQHPRCGRSHDQPHAWRDGRFGQGDPHPRRVGGQVGDGRRRVCPSACAAAGALLDSVPQDRLQRPGRLFYHAGQSTTYHVVYWLQPKGTGTGGGD